MSMCQDNVRGSEIRVLFGKAIQISDDSLRHYKCVQTIQTK